MLERVWKRRYQSFRSQTYPQIELVVIDDVRRSKPLKPSFLPSQHAKHEALWQHDYTTA